jgi:hypothetical protein
MMRHLADAAPQAGEQAFRSGQAAPDRCAMLPGVAPQLDSDSL